ncbi:MAG TPA: hypothetical protein PL138_04490, partial [Bacillota bacterium]|nr:hypothetical protein [Bacillota bacterium]
MGLLSLYLIINIVFGAALYLMRSSQLAAAALIILMTASGFVFIARLSSISGRIKHNIEEISKGQLNKNVKKTGIIMFDSIASATNEFLLKIRGVIGSFGDVSKRIMKDAHGVEKQAEAIRYSSGEIAST